MHIPDGALSPVIWAGADVLAAGMVGYAVAKTNGLDEEPQVPMMGVMAAFVFAAQLVDFPLPGTSLHLIGAVLAAVLLGPWAGTLVMAAVFIIQALFFQDGGLLALGANTFNMGLVGTVGGYYLYMFVRKIVGGNRGILVGTAIVSWVAVVLGSVLVAVELGVSGSTPLAAGLPIIGGVYAFLGIGEALLTTAIVSFILRVRPDLVPGALSKGRESSAS